MLNSRGCSYNPSEPQLGIYILQSSLEDPTGETNWLQRKDHHHVLIFVWGGMEIYQMTSWPPTQSAYPQRHQPTSFLPHALLQLQLATYIKCMSLSTCVALFLDSHSVPSASSSVLEQIAQCQDSHPLSSPVGVGFLSPVFPLRLFL